MISNLLAIRNRLVDWLGLALLAFIATMVLGQGVAFANVLTPLAQPVGLNVNPKAQNPFEPELIPALAARAQQSPATAPVVKVTASPTQTSPPVDEHWLADLIQGEMPALAQPLAWATVEGRPLVTPTRAAEPATRARVLEAFGRSPLHFEPNQGQAAEPVKFLARAPGYQLYLTPAEAVLALRGAQPATVRMHLVGEGVNSQPVVEALDALPGRSHYYLGNDPQRWQTDVPHFAKVRYAQVYPGVDWVLYGNPRQLEYDFVVAPGADPTQIALTFAGADETRIAANGELVVAVAGREVLHSAPTLYQMVDGERRPVEGRYVVREAADATPVVGFEVAAYDPKRPLVIDPVIYFTFMDCAQADVSPPTDLCSGRDDFGQSITVDSIGNAYITGFTSSDNFLFNTANNFPTPTYDTALAGPTDAFIVRLDIGGGIAYATYLGGSSYDYGYGIALDNQGHFYVTGSTRSADFPVLNPVQAALGGTQDAFVASFDVATGQLRYSTYLGGSTNNASGGGGVEAGRAIIVDHQGSAYVAGYTNSTDFPVQGPFDPIQGGGDGPFDPTYNNLDDVFVTKLNPAGSALVYSTFLGGSGDERGFGIVLDAAGNAYVTGYTDSPDFPNCVTLGGLHNNYEEVFVTRLSVTGNALGYSTCFGGSRYDRGHGIDIDASNNVYITGYTDSPDVAGAINLYSSDGRGFDTDAFLARLDQNGQPFVNASNQPAFFTYLGGNANDIGYGIAVDCCGSMGTYITGYTVSPDFPLLRADDVTWAGGTEAFITRLDSVTGILTYSSFWGGNGTDYGMGIALDAALDVYVTGYANSNTDFIITPADPRFKPDTFDGKLVQIFSGYDAFVVKVAIPISNSFTVSVTGGGTGSGKIGSDPAGIACTIPDPADDPGGLNSGDCYEAYVPDTQVTLTATPDPGSAFAGWSGDCKGTVPCVLKTDANKQVTATFQLDNTHQMLTVTTVGSGAASGTVTSNPAGITCGSDCNENYATGASVVLTATADTGATFTGWSGDACVGVTVPTCTVIMDVGKEVSANFTVPEFALTVLKTGTGTGTVASNPVGISCGADCTENTENYASGTVVTLTATPDAGFVFNGWSGACTGTGTCQVTMTQTRDVTANFTATYLLTVTKDGTGVGTVTGPLGTADRINCGSDCNESYPMNTVVNLAAVASTGSVFAGWSGACTGLWGCVVTMDAAKNVKVTFNSTVPAYTLTVSKAGVGTGTVVSSPVGINCGADCTENYASGTVVMLTATPDAGFVFNGWSGACTGTSTCQVTMTQARDVTATFAASTCPASSGDVNGDGSVNALDVVAVTNHILGIQTSPNTDVNCDGAVNALDVVFVINKALGL